jgi:transposase
MLVVETIAKIRRAHFVQGKPIKQICRELKLSRKTVRKVLRSEETAFEYRREVQPQPKLGPWVEALDEMLRVNAGRGARDRATLLRVFEDLRGLGYEGGYDAVRRYAAAWKRRQGTGTAAAFVPLIFDPGEAYQFDWSHEVVLIAGVTTTVKVAHLRLCHSRMPFIRAYPRETQEMVFDAHDRAFVFWRGTCTRGIYDSEEDQRLIRWINRPTNEDRGGHGVRRQAARVQPPLPADVRPLSDRADGLHAGGRLGKGPG